MISTHQTWMSVIAALAFFAGCATRGDVDLLESQLREREDRLAEVQAELAETRSELEHSRQDLAMLRGQAAKQGVASLLPEQVDLLHRATGVKFGSLLTSGIDRDGLPGDEALSVLLAPHDSDGDLLKLAGAIELQVFDLAEAGGLQLGAWSWTAEESRRLWHHGLFASGYLIEVPWKQVPAHPELTLHARFTTVDGRHFDTTQQIRIKPPTSASVDVPDAVWESPEGSEQSRTELPTRLEVEERDANETRPPRASLLRRVSARIARRISPQPRPGTKADAAPVESGSDAAAGIRDDQDSDGTGDGIGGTVIQTSDRWSEREIPTRR